MASEQFSLRLPRETKSKLEELAKATGRTKAYLALDAIEKYLHIEAWQIDAIQDGIKNIDNNESVSIEDVKKDWGINQTSRKSVAK